MTTEAVEARESGAQAPIPWCYSDQEARAIVHFLETSVWKLLANPREDMITLIMQLAERPAPLKV